MTDKSAYAPGEPSWIDLATDDVAAAKTFYTTVFGWVADDVPMEDAGGYGMFTLGGRYVGGYQPVRPDQPLAWSVYVAVDDVAKTCEIVAGAGGTVAMGPVDVLTSGRMAVVQDPGGAFLSLWQAGGHHGAQVQDEPGALTWVELTTDDVEAATAFYAEVFGWVAEASDSGTMEYTELKLGDRSVAGVMPKQPGMPAGMPSYWMPYLQPADLDRTIADATALGAQVMAPKMAIPHGEFAVLTDPRGAAFGLYRPSTASPTD